MKTKTKKARAWNWCHKCKQPIDIDELAFDGQEYTCDGCGRVFVVVEYESPKDKPIDLRMECVRRKPKKKTAPKVTTWRGYGVWVDGRVAFGHSDQNKAQSLCDYWGGKLVRVEARLTEVKK